MTILLTGFEPFSTWKKNPSYDVAVAFKGKNFGNHKIVCEKLPVDYKRLPLVIDNLFLEHSPDIIIMMGIAAGSPKMRLEKVAINEVTAKVHYNSGEKPIDEPIINNGQNAFFSKLPVNDLSKNLIDHGIPAEISYSAGTFACNQAFYYLMHKINSNTKRNNVLGGFVHLPLTPDMAAKVIDKKYPSMNFDQMVLAVKIIIEFLVSIK
ncbi:MAG: pyroglutamyl-peptidase I [Candidatus Thorarchaeota archaeon]